MENDPTAVNHANRDNFPTVTRLPLLRLLCLAPAAAVHVGPSQAALKQRNTDEERNTS